MEFRSTGGKSATIRRMRVHFTGIKGVGMTALALAYQDAGWEIQGSDTSEAQITDEPLKKRKVKVFERFTPRNISKIENSKWKPIIDKLIYTGAHHGFHNVEVQWARSRGVPIQNYAQAVGELFDDKKQVVVCGVGGKTTTTAMITTVLRECGMELSWLVGTSEIASLPASGHGDEKGEWAVIEADEYWADPVEDKQSKFRYLTPQIIVCTNLCHDHPDAFPTMKEFVENYWNFFIGNGSCHPIAPSDNPRFRCSDRASCGCPACRQAGSIGRPIGCHLLLVLSNQVGNILTEYIPDWEEELEKRGIKWIIFDSDQEEMRELAKVMKVPGEYNVRNGMAAVEVAQIIGIDRQKAIKGLGKYKGAKRRFEHYGSINGIDLYDDYAHHPYEITSLIKTAREKFGGRKLRIVFHPHTYSRTKALFEEFVESLKLADETVLIPIFASAREKADPTISSAMLAQSINRRGGEAKYFADWDKMVEYLAVSAKAGDVIITVGAGDVYKIISKLKCQISGCRPAASSDLPRRQAGDPRPHCSDRSDCGRSMRHSAGRHPLIELLGEERVLIDEPMSRHAYLGLGGPADLFYVAKNVDELEKAVKIADEYQIQWFILGGGSNILVGDLGIRGLVIKNEASKIRYDGCYLTAESGVRLNQVVSYANEQGLAGLANYISIPGTVGGAIYNNSHGWPDRKQLIGNLVDRAVILDQGIRKTVNQKWFEFGYDGSKLHHHSAVLLEVTFKLKRGDPIELKKISMDILKIRNQKQPIGLKCAGCMFANPRGDAAGRLIDAAGLKGKSIGGAEVSTLHANFIINRGDAKVKEVLELMALVKNKVKEQFKVELRPEIFLVGEFSAGLERVIKDINYRS